MTISLTKKRSQFVDYSQPILFNINQVFLMFVRIIWFSIFLCLICFLLVFLAQFNNDSHEANRHDRDACKQNYTLYDSHC